MLSGYINSCKACCSVYKKLQRFLYPEKFKQYEDIRSKLPHRIALNIIISKKYKQDNPDRYKATNKVNKRSDFSN